MRYDSAEDVSDAVAKVYNWNDRKRMFQEQRRRFYPLPDFDLSHPDKVVVTVHGKVIDPNYTALLMDQQDLSLETVILLDRIQKQSPVDKDDVKPLRKEGLVEGRYPNLFVAAHVASITGDRAQYIKNRAFDDEHYKQKIVEFFPSCLIELLQELGFLGHHHAARAARATGTAAGRAERWR